MPDISTESNLQEPDKGNPFNITPKKAPEGFFGKFVARIKSTFKPEQPATESPLAGRIFELQSMQHELKDHLAKIKDEEEAKDHSPLKPFVEVIILPLIKEGDHLEKCLHSNSVSEQTRAYKLYNEWVDRANHWTMLYHQAEDENIILDAVVQQLVNDSLRSLERDIQVIEDYQMHAIDSAKTQDSPNQIEIEIINRVTPFLQQLESLKAVPEQLTLQTVGKWKQYIDRMRQGVFEAALVAVDNAVHEHTPAIEDHEEEQLHLVDVIQEINFLEEVIEPIPDLLKNREVTKDLRKRLIDFQLPHLAKEAHRLNGDLRLTTELSDRLQGIIQKIQQVEDLLSNNQEE